MRLSYDQLLLPFAEREYIDVRRTAHILGLSYSTVLDLYTAGEIEMIDYAKKKRKRVRYASVVALCDSLRDRYCIADRRPPLASSMLRHRDADLLPFPIEDTIYVEQVMEILGYSSETSVYRMIEEGRFEAYRVPGNRAWRISRSSFVQYLDSVRSKESLRPSAPRGSDGREQYAVTH